MDSKETRDAYAGQAQHVDHQDDEKPSSAAPTAAGGAARASSDPSKTYHDVVDYAKLASEKEQKMSLIQGIRLYPKAIAWSFVISTCIVMEGYDVALVNNFYAFTPFNEKYGVLQKDGTYQVPSPWQAGLSNVSYPADLPST